MSRRVDLRRDDGPVNEGGRAAGRLALVAVAAALVFGCSLLPTGPTVVTLRTSEGSYELPVALYDPDGLVATVVAAEPDPAGPDRSLVRVDDASATIRWLGGACDSRTQINVRLHDRTISLALRTDGSSGNCIALGIPRAVTLSFREPLGDRTIEWPDAGLTATEGGAGGG